MSREGQDLTKITLEQIIAKKRFKVTKSGKVMFARTDRGHFLTEKSQSRKRKLRRAGVLSKTQSKNIKRLINA